MGGDDVDDLWKAVNDLRAGQGAMLVSLGRIEAMLNERCDMRAKKLEDHEARLRTVEHRVWWASGAAAVIGIVVSFAVKHFGQ